MTCTAQACRTSLVDIRVPQPGQIQMSFLSSAVLRYTLQYTTNLPGGQWLDVCTVSGNNSMMTLSHTNPAARSFYRLLIQ